MDRLHADEVDTSEVVVRSLLASQCPSWAQHPLSPLANTGTSNSLWRIRRDEQADLVVRLPRTSGLERGIRSEHRLLPALADAELEHAFDVPILAYEGTPDDTFPLHWSVLQWVEGDDLWSVRNDPDLDEHQLASELARTVQVIGLLKGLPAPDRQPGDRGGPLLPLIERLDRWLDDPRFGTGIKADGLIDTVAVRRSAAQSAEVAGDVPVIGFVHGDLLPGNLLTKTGSLSAVIDWGGAGHGDQAEDLLPAWAILGPEAGKTFRSLLEIDDATWLRSRAFALEQAVGGVLYYGPKRHPLGDIMARTLDRILTESD